MVKLGEVCENYDNKRKPVEKSERKSGKYSYYGASGIVDYVDSYIFDGNFLLVSEDGANLLMRTTPIAFSISGKNWVNNHAHILKFESSDTQNFVEVYLNQINLEIYITGMAQPKLNQAALNKIEIPFPPLDIQREIVAEIGTDRKAIDGCQELMVRYEERIRRVVDGVWGG
jgi:type I restriction enzyme S subunit